MSIHNVIGSGVAGLSVAAELVNRGAQVRLWEASTNIGPHQCSWWAGGMLAPWCEYENAEEPVMRLGQKAAGWWSQFTDVVSQGTLVVAHRRDVPDLKRFSRKTECFSMVGQDEIRALEPELIGFSNGLFFESEAHLSPRHALEGLWDFLIEQGVEIMPSVAPDKIENAIDCRGYAARDVLPDLRGVKGEMLIVGCKDVTLTRPVRLLHPRIPVYIVPRENGEFMIGATMIESEDRSRITARSMLELLSSAYALNPAFGEAEVLEIGVDLRPAFPDNLPRVQKIGDRVYANGLYRHGYLLAPALAEATADLVLENKKTELFYAH